MQAYVDLNLAEHVCVHALRLGDMVKNAGHVYTNVRAVD